MAKLKLGDRIVDADLIIFDKDGTLIDFVWLWAQKTLRGVERLVKEVKGTPALRIALLHSLGYNEEAELFDMGAPTATAAMHKLYTIAAAVLYQNGFTWLDAEEHVSRTYAAEMAKTVTEDMLKPTGDLPRLFKALHDAGVEIAVITSDNAATAEATLKLLELTDYVEIIIGGDSEHPEKPSPDAIRYVCQHYGVDPLRTVMVGDTVTDMEMGRRAGVGCRLGVLTGASSRDELAAHADVILDSVNQIEVVQP
jgi:phosphoglycolate phosphatase